jgi:hypothetical protein
MSTITIRRSDVDDVAALHDLAALDSRHAPSAPVLLAEVDGSLRAAVSLRDGALVADPFVDTRSITPLLITRAEQLLGDGAVRRRGLTLRRVAAA